MKYEIQLPYKSFHLYNVITQYLCWEHSLSTHAVMHSCNNSLATSLYVTSFWESLETGLEGSRLRYCITTGVSTTLQNFLNKNMGLWLSILFPILSTVAMASVLRVINQQHHRGGTTVPWWGVHVDVQSEPPCCQFCLQQCHTESGSVCTLAIIYTVCIFSNMMVTWIRVGGILRTG